MAPRSAEQADQAHGLVGGDAAGHAHHDPASGQGAAGLAHAGCSLPAGCASRAARMRSQRVADAAQGEVRLHAVDARHVGQPRLVGVAAGGDHRHAAAGGGAFDQLAAQGGEQAGHQADVPQHRAGLHGGDGIGADGVLRPPQLDARQLAGPPDQRLQRDAEAGGDGAADVGAVGVDHVEVGAGAQVDDDGRAADLDPGRQRVAQPVGAGLGRPVDLDRQDALERGRVDHHRLQAKPVLRELDEALGQRRHDRGDPDRRQLVQPMGVEAEHVTHQRRRLVRRGAGPRRGAPRPDQLVLAEEAERQAGVADIERQERHGRHRNSRFRLRRASRPAPSVRV